jgi:1-deoxy-D-xylulose-5-phosphate synthase
VVHVITRKGKGYARAEDDPGNYHTVTPGEKRLSFSDAFGAALLPAASRDSRVTALTAAMEKGVGLSLFNKAYPNRFFDVGIAEGHAVTFAAGMAVRGLEPVVAVYSTFIQRSIDQIIHDTALQNLPVLFALDRSGFVGGDGETHQGLFDIALFRPVPRMTILAPASENELRIMLDYALRLNGPAMIRYPKALCPEEQPPFSLPLETGRGVWLHRGFQSRILLAFTGSLFPQALEAARKLQPCTEIRQDRGSPLLAEGTEIDLYNLRFLKPVDEDYLADIMNNYDQVIFAEEGILSGGFGEYAAALARHRNCRAEIAVFAVSGDFASDGRALGTRDELLRFHGLDGNGIAEGIGRVAVSREQVAI